MVRCAVRGQNACEWTNYTSPLLHLSSYVETELLLDHLTLVLWLNIVQYNHLYVAPHNPIQGHTFRLGESIMKSLMERVLSPSVHSRRIFACRDIAKLSLAWHLHIYLLILLLLCYMKVTKWTGTLDLLPSCGREVHFSQSLNIADIDKQMQKLGILPMSNLTIFRGKRLQCAWESLTEVLPSCTNQTKAHAGLLVFKYWPSNFLLMASFELA